MHTQPQPQPQARTRRLAWPALSLCALLLASPLTKAAPQASAADRAHARAVESFRNGRFPEAYGRFVELAGQGHAASARYALFMCEHGRALFGKDWDCAPHEADDWAQLAGVAVPQGLRYPVAATPDGARRVARR